MRQPCQGPRRFHERPRKPATKGRRVFRSLLRSDLHAAHGRKPSFTREQFVKVRSMLDQQTACIARLAKETGLTRQTVNRIKDDPAGAEGCYGCLGGCE